jgi:transcriptional regulator with XRE-family HTH domain
MNFDKEEMIILRKKMGWSVFDLSRRLGCHSSEIEKWEMGTQTPPDAIIDKLFQFKKDLDFNAESLSKAPFIEKIMVENGVDQLSDSIDDDSQN